MRNAVIRKKLIIEHYRWMKFAAMPQRIIMPSYGPPTDLREYAQPIWGGAR